MQYASGKVIQGKRWRKTMSSLGDRWVEPFAGGLGAYQQIAPSYKSALVSDLSPVMKMWQAVKDGWEPDPNLIANIDVDVCREIAFGPNPTPQSVYTLHAMSFRGMARGQFGTGAMTPTSGLARLKAVGTILRLVPTEIYQRDYRITLSECGRGDVVYLDPPYSKQAGGPDRRSWINPDNKFDFNDAEMLILAEQAVSRGAVVFISHYDEALNPEYWRVVEIHSDMSTARVKGESLIKRYHEYLYVDIRTNYRFDFRGDASRTRRNRRASQAAVRQDLISLIGHRCEATGKIFPKSQLALVHGPGYEYYKTGDSDPSYCYLVNLMFHAALDDSTIGVKLENGKWVVPEPFQDLDWAKGAHGAAAKRFRGLKEST